MRKRLTPMEKGRRIGASGVRKGKNYPCGGELRKKEKDGPTNQPYRRHYRSQVVQYADKKKDAPSAEFSGARGRGLWGVKPWGRREKREEKSKARVPHVAPCRQAPGAKERTSSRIIIRIICPLF